MVSGCIRQLFNKTILPVIGMIHLKPLPGTLRGRFSVDEIVEASLNEAEIYKSANIDGMMIENMNDLPYIQNKHFGPEIVATMTRVASEIRKLVPRNIACGIQILAGGNKEGLAVSMAAGLQFVRCEGYVFSHVADEGWIDSCAGILQRYKKTLSIDNDILVFADIKKKHSSHAITNDISLVETAEAAEFFMADGVIITGKATGSPTSDNDLKDIKKATNIPVLIGSGVTLQNIDKFSSADGVIVGSYFKKNGRWNKPLDSSRIQNFMEKVHKIRDNLA